MQFPFTENLEKGRPTGVGSRFLQTWMLKLPGSGCIRPRQVNALQLFVYFKSLARLAEAVSNQGGTLGHAIRGSRARNGQMLKENGSAGSLSLKYFSLGTSV